MPRKDRRVERTHAMLREALFALTREKGFESLTVQEILDRANVGRATFYAHFQNKEDLLVSGLDDVRARLKALQREAPDERFAFTRELFAHAGEHRELFRALAGKDSGAAVLRIWRRTIVELMRGEAPGDEATVQFLAGGLFGVLMWWFEGKSGLTVDEVDGVFRRLATPAVTSSFRGSTTAATGRGRKTGSS